MKPTPSLEQPQPLRQGLSRACSDLAALWRALAAAAVGGGGGGRRARGQGGVAAAAWIIWGGGPLRHTPLPTCQLRCAAVGATRLRFPGLTEPGLHHTKRLFLSPPAAHALPQALLTRLDGVSLCARGREGAPPRPAPGVRRGVHGDEAGVLIERPVLGTARWTGGRRVHAVRCGEVG